MSGSKDKGGTQSPMQPPAQITSKNRNYFFLSLLLLKT